MHHLELRKEEIDSFARQLVSDLKLKGIVITLGENGVYVLDEKLESRQIPTKAREVYNVSGAGDTFIAAFTSALIITKDWFTAARAGNLAAGVVIGKVGTATATIEEIFNHLDWSGRNTKTHELKLLTDSPPS